MRKKQMNSSINNKGITLIALVITIIIILILAGIVISKITKNGLIENARLASIKTQEARAEEILNVEIMKVQADHKGNADVKDIYNAFKDSDNSKIDVIEVESEEEATISFDESGVKEVIKEIKVVVEGFSQFDFSIDKSCTITKICGIAKNEWNGETINNNLPQEGKYSFEACTINITTNDLLTISGVENMVGYSIIADRQMD